LFSFFTDQDTFSRVSRGRLTTLIFWLAASTATNRLVSLPPFSSSSPPTRMVWKRSFRTRAAASLPPSGSWAEGPSPSAGSGSGLGTGSLEKLLYSPVRAVAAKRRQTAVTANAWRGEVRLLLRLMEIAPSLV